MALFAKHVAQFMVFWHSKHGRAGQSWVLGLVRNAFRGIRAGAAMTKKDMNEDQMRRSGQEQFGLVRAIYSEGIKDMGGGPLKVGRRLL